MLSQDELPGSRVVVQTRTSNPGGSSETSHDRQDGYLEDEIQKLKNHAPVEVVKRFNLKESAATMDRESIEEIIEMAKNDEFDILMVWAIHRLSRANPWDTFEFLLKLREYEVVVYSDRDGYFDWDNPDDASRLSNRISTSREWRNEIDRGARENNAKHLKKGRWPYGTPPYGTYKKGADDDEVDHHELVLKNDHEWIPNECFKAFEEGLDEEEIAEHVKSLIEKRGLDIDPPSKFQVRNILGNEVFVGHLVLKRTGELIQKKEDLQCVDPELFTAVQKMRSDSDQDKGLQFGNDEFPEFVYRLILRFGQEYVVENVDAIRWCCPKCNSTDINLSDTTVEFWDINIPKIYCKESHCNYNGPAIRMKELHEIDTTLPLICSDCQRTGDFDVEPVDFDSGNDYYKYTCRHCGGTMIKDKQPNSVLRALDDPDNAIDLKGTPAANSTSDISTSDGISESADDKGSSSSIQMGLQSFT